MTEEELKNAGLPVHVAIIMDGNGRWAKQKGLSRTAGHKEGLQTAKKIVGKVASLGIKYVTLYTFSTENWKRTQEEVGYLMMLIKNHLRAEFRFYKENGIKIEHIGNLEGLGEDVRKEIINAKKDTARFSGTTCVLAINYGSRDEITRGIKKLLKKISADTAYSTANDAINKIDDIDENTISQNLDIPNLPDVDLVIRTGGEKRLSNFLLWQSAYAEFIFTDTLWPDYSAEEFDNHIKEFQSRNRRFGAVPETQ